MGWAIALHGGAVGVALAESEHNQHAQEDALRCYLQIGVELLKSGKPALDVVELMVREMENNPDFNAGKGSVLNSEGKVSMDACIMDGNTRKCGAVSGLQTVVNPVSLARVVMDNSPHVFLAFDGAETFAREQGVETLDSSHFITPKNIKRLKREKEIASKRQLDFVPTNPKDVKNDKWTPNGDGRFGTVGCVAVDSNRNLAAATSTGGMPNKMVGRIGDTPIIGAGTYANNLCAVSVTGDGDVIISETLARNVAALMEYKGLSINDAAVHALESMPRNTAGLVAVSATGEVSMPFNTEGLLRACATEDGYSEIGIMA